MDIKGKEKSITDIDEKVKKIKNEIKRNEYKIAPEKIAEKMIEFFKRLKKR